MTRDDSRRDVGGVTAVPRMFLTVTAPILVVAAVGYLLARLRLIEDPRALSRVATHSLLPALAFSGWRGPS